MTLIVLMAKLISILFIIYGCVLMLKGGVLTALLDYAKVGNRIYAFSIAKSLVGAVLIAASFMDEVAVKWVVLIFGLLMFSAAPVVFYFKKEKMIPIIDKFKAMTTPKSARLVGAIPILVGTLILCAI